jgi:hypothetical protein
MGWERQDGEVWHDGLSDELGTHGGKSNGTSTKGKNKLLKEHIYMRSGCNRLLSRKTNLACYAYNFGSFESSFHLIKLTQGPAFAPLCFVPNTSSRDWHHAKSARIFSNASMDSGSHGKRGNT